MVAINFFFYVHLLGSVILFPSSSRIHVIFAVKFANIGDAAMERQRRANRRLRTAA